jgi:hypothetical protein
MYCWSCGLAYGNGNLVKKPVPFRLPSRLHFLIGKSFIGIYAIVIMFLLAYGTYEFWQHSRANQFQTKMTGIEFSGIRLFMSRQEIVNRFGIGEDKTVGCFGCEMNFVYPELGVSGRFSETLDDMPLVKRMTTSEASDVLFGFKVGDSPEAAEENLLNQGFRKESKGLSERYFVKGLYYVQLWEDDGMIGSLTVGYRVKPDEEIQY